MDIKALSLADFSARLGFCEHSQKGQIAAAEIASVRLDRRRLIPTTALADKLAGSPEKRA
jgi:hypothetical protein